MQKGYKIWCAVALVSILAIQPVQAASQLFRESPHPEEEAAGMPTFVQKLSSAFEPYIKGTVVIRQKLYEHLLQSEDFIRLQSMAEYIWMQRSAT